MKKAFTVLFVIGWIITGPILCSIDILYYSSLDLTLDLAPVLALSIIPGYLWLPPMLYKWYVPDDVVLVRNRRQIDLK